MTEFEWKAFQKQQAFQESEDASLKLFRKQMMGFHKEDVSRYIEISARKSADKVKRLQQKLEQIKLELSKSKNEYLKKSNQAYYALKDLEQSKKDFTLMNQQVIAMKQKIQQDERKCEQIGRELKSFQYENQLLKKDNHRLQLEVERLDQELHKRDTEMIKINEALTQTNMRMRQRLQHVQDMEQKVMQADIHTKEMLSGVNNVIQQQHGQAQRIEQRENKTSEFLEVTQSVSSQLNMMEAKLSEMDEMIQQASQNFEMLCSAMQSALNHVNDCIAQAEELLTVNKEERKCLHQESEQSNFGKPHAPKPSPFAPFEGDAFYQQQKNVQSTQKVSDDTKKNVAVKYTPQLAPVNPGTTFSKPLTQAPHRENVWQNGVCETEDCWGHMELTPAQKLLQTLNQMLEHS